MPTFSRIFNFLRLVCGYLISRLVRRPLHSGFPAAVSIEPANLCNLHCPECPSGMKNLSRPAGIMDIQLFTSIIDQLSPQLAWLTLYFQGEPYLNPGFFEFISYAKSKGICVNSSTNGHFLTSENAGATVRSGLDRLIISVDGTDESAYSSYRMGGKFEKVLEGIRALSESKKSSGSKKPVIVIQFLILKTNQHQINEIKTKGLQWGGDKVTIKTAQFYDFKNGNPLMPDNEKHSRYASLRQETAGTLKSPASGSSMENKGPSPDELYSFSIKNTLPRHCFRMWSSCVITWDGKVVPCCFDKDAGNTFGSLKDKSFKEIWKSPAYNDFRRKILEKRKQIDICTNCSEGTGITRWF